MAIYIRPIYKKILAYSGLILIPVIIGLPFSFGFQNFTILEICFAVLGILELIYACLRFGARDKQNYKKNKSVAVDKTSPEYKEFWKLELKIFIFALINIAGAAITGVIVAACK